MMKIVSQQVRGTFAVEQWEIEGGFTLEMIRSLSRAQDEPFLPASVSKDGKLLWEYQRQHRGFRGIAQLIDRGDEYFIALTTRDELYEVIPLLDLSRMRKIGDSWIGGRDIGEIIVVKQKIAQKMRLKPVWSTVERQMLNHLETTTPQETHHAARKELAAARAAERAAAEAAKAATRVAREAKRARINGRQRLFVFTEKGDRRHGIPIVGDEWMCLQDGAFCISVTTFDELTGAVGDVIESFAVVKKGGGNPSRAHITAVTRENSVKPTAATFDTSKLEVKVLTINGSPQPVVMTRHMDEVRALNAQGLNSGTLAMCPKQNDPGRYSVFRLMGGKIEAVTEVMRKQG